MTPQKAQELADTGSAVKTTGGTKKKTTRSSGSSSSSKSSSKSSSGRKKSSGSASGSSEDYSYKTWEGTTTGSGYIDGPNGNTYEEFTW